MHELIEKKPRFDIKVSSELKFSNPMVSPLNFR